MKFVLLLVFMILICLTFSNPVVTPRSDSLTIFVEHLKKVSKPCESQYGISETQLSSLLFGLLNADQPTNIYCYISCVANNLGLVNPDNTFNAKEVNGLIAFMKGMQNRYEGIDSLDQIEKSINICLKEQIPGDGCEVAKKFAQCIDKVMAHEEKTLSK